MDRGFDEVTEQIDQLDKPRSQPAETVKTKGVFAQNRALDPPCGRQLPGALIAFVNDLRAGKKPDPVARPFNQVAKIQILGEQKIIFRHAARFFDRRAPRQHKSAVEPVGIA